MLFSSGIIVFTLFGTVVLGSTAGSTTVTGADAVVPPAVPLLPATGVAAGAAAGVLAAVGSVVSVLVAAVSVVSVLVAAVSVVSVFVAAGATPSALTVIGAIARVPDIASAATFTLRFFFLICILPFS